MGIEKAKTANELDFVYFFRLDKKKIIIEKKKKK